MYIYLLTFSNGRRYIGQTIKTVEHRFNHHRNCANAGSQLAVHCAWRKYGVPMVETVASYVSLDELNAAEVAAIAKCGTMAPNGYNVALGGANGGTVKSPLVRAKMSESSKGKKASPETKAKLSAASIARWADPKYRAKQAAGIAASFTPERRKFLSANATRIHKGRVVSEETKQKLRAVVKGDAWRERQRLAQTGKVRGTPSAETKRKLSKSIKATHNSMGRSAAIRSALAAKTPEQRRETALKAWATKRAKGV